MQGSISFWLFVATQLIAANADMTTVTVTATPTSGDSTTSSASSSMTTSSSDASSAPVTSSTSTSTSSTTTSSDPASTSSSDQSCTYSINEGDKKWTKASYQHTTTLDWQGGDVANFKVQQWLQNIINDQGGDGLSGPGKPCNSKLGTSIEVTGDTEITGVWRYTLGAGDYESCVQAIGQRFQSEFDCSPGSAPSSS